MNIKRKKIPFFGSYPFLCIEIFETDEITNFFKIDKDLLNKKNIENKDIFIIKSSKDNDFSFSFGKIINIDNKIIKHYQSIKSDFLCSPIIRRDNYKLIGINFGEHNDDFIQINNCRYQLNIGISFYYIIQEIINRTIIKIIAKFYINDTNKEIKIINSYEQFKRENSWFEVENENESLFENEKEFKENIKIKINNKKIGFKYFYKFKEKGEYIIEYSILSEKKNEVTKLDFMFSECDSLMNVDLSDEVFRDVINLSYMFFKCKLLKEIKLSYIFDSKITNMRRMFKSCESIEYIDLSRLNIENVTDISEMFSFCKSLECIELPEHICKNIIDMSGMFAYCQSLKELYYLHSLETQNVTNMKYMFYYCRLLHTIDLSHFNTENVVDMQYMFSHCDNLE